MYIALILILSCSITPFHIAFDKPHEIKQHADGRWQRIDYLFDASFLLDIIFSFLSAYYDEDFYIIDDLK